MKAMKKFEQIIHSKMLQARQQAEENRHHQIHAKAAWQYINDLERLNGWHLTEEIKNQADAYAIRVFGKVEYAPWLYFFSLFKGEFKEGWIPLNFYSRYILPDSSLARVACAKTFSKVVLNTDALPDIGYFLNGTLYDKNFSKMSFNEFRRMVENEYGQIFVKRDNSLRGMYNYKLGIDQINADAFQNIGNCVIQYVVKEHQFFSEIVESSTAAIRMVTVRNLMGEMEFRGSYLKLGRKDREMYRSGFGIQVPVVDESGQLDEYCYGHRFQQYTTHPDTNVGLSNKKIPRFVDAVEFCLKLHATIPHFPIVGWDVAIDHDQNIKLFEWNAGAPHPGIKMLEGALGPCFTGLGWEDLPR